MLLERPLKRSKNPTTGRWLLSNPPPLAGFPPQRLNIDRCISISARWLADTLLRLCLYLCQHVLTGHYSDINISKKNAKFWYSYAYAYVVAVLTSAEASFMLMVASLVWSGLTWYFVTQRGNYLISCFQFAFARSEIFQKKRQFENCRSICSEDCF